MVYYGTLWYVMVYHGILWYIMVSGFWLQCFRALDRFQRSRSLKNCCSLSEEDGQPVERLLSKSGSGFSISPVLSSLLKFQHPCVPLRV